MRVLLPVVAALVPAVILPGFSFYFDITPKIVILLLGVALSLVFWSGSGLPRKARRWIPLLAAAVCLVGCHLAAINASCTLVQWRKLASVRISLV